MGLDMYLNAKIYLSKYDDKEDKREQIYTLFPEMFESGNLEYVKVAFEVGYWRKANHIHKWFVDNCQDEDDCKPYYVSREQLKALRKLCEEILKDSTLAEVYLPTQEGFFFGSEEYGEWYFDDLKDTIKIIDKCLKLPEEWEFEYQSSW